MALFGKLFRKKEEPPFVPSDEAQAIMALCDFPCKAIDSSRLTPSGAMQLYRDALAEGRREGFIPLIIIPSAILLETLEMQAEEDAKAGHKGAEAREVILAKARNIDASAYIKARYREAMTFGDDDAIRESELIGDMAEGNPLHEFISLKAYDGNNGLCPEIILAQIPAADSCELPAWVPMGGFNDCPAPDEQVAVFRYWQRAFGAHPAVVGYDTWECYVEQPPQDNNKAMALALEQMAFCPDLVFQGVETVGALADCLRQAPVWFFWWD